MCLYSNHGATEEFRELHKNTDTIVCHKVLFRNFPLFLSSPNIPNYHWSVGENKARFEGPNLVESFITDLGRVFKHYYGIHVFLEEEGYQTFKEEVAVKVICKLEDLIAVGNDYVIDGIVPPQQAIFSKVELTQEEWDKAVNADSEASFLRMTFPSQAFFGTTKVFRED